MPAPPAVRVAEPNDVPEVVRLAEIMFRSLGIDPGATVWESFRRSAREALGRRLDDDAVYVVDHPTEPGRLVSCGAGVIIVRLPTPARIDGRVGYIHWMSTDPDHRRLGMGRAVLRALLAWFADRGVDNVELHASADGAPLYKSEGFWRGTGGEPMRRRPWDPPPGP